MSGWTEGPCTLGQVDSLQYATLATVSRCGMVWFSAAEEDGADKAAGDSDTGDGTSKGGTVTSDMLLRHKVGQSRALRRPQLTGLERCFSWNTVVHQHFLEPLMPQLFHVAGSRKVSHTRARWTATSSAALTLCTVHV